jgi:hypothetical protein
VNDTEKLQCRRVTRAIKLALARIAQKDAELARLLSKTIETGQYLSYSPPSEESPARKSRRAKKPRPGQGRNSAHQA